MVVALGAAVAVGLLAATSPQLAVAGFVAVVAVPAAVLRPKVITHVLVASIFAQSITIKGLTVSRLVAPLAVLAVLAQLINAPVRLREAEYTLSAVAAYALLALASVFWTLSLPETLNSLG